MNRYRRSGITQPPPNAAMGSLGLWVFSPAPMIFMSSPARATPGPAGDFTFPRVVLPLTYAFEFDLPDGLFLADIRQGQRSINRDGAVIITGEAPEPLQIVLGRDPASIH